MTISMVNSEEERSSFVDKHSCLIAQVTTLPPMLETMLPSKTSYKDIQLDMTHEMLAQKRLALVVQDIVNTAPRVPFFIKITNLTL